VEIKTNATLHHLRRNVMANAIDSGEQECVIVEEIAIAAAHLKRHLHGRLYDAGVSVHAGGVVISGHTGYYYVKQLAQHAIMNRVTLPIVANEIEVRRAYE
jgi:hypothetical protein